MAAVAGASEAGGGLLLALGLLTPLAGAALVGTLLVAGSVHLDKGVWATNGGLLSGAAVIARARWILRREAEPAATTPPTELSRNPATAA